MKCSVSQNGASATIKVEGKLTATEAPELEAAVEGLGADVRDITLNLAGLEYIASAGLRVLVATGKTAASRGGKLTIAEPSKEVMDILEMTGLAGIFAIEK